MSEDGKHGSDDEGEGKGHGCGGCGGGCGGKDKKVAEYVFEPLDADILEDPEKVGKTLIKIVDGLVDRLDMHDWSINLIYAPDEYNNKAAEVTFGVNKEADLTVYQFRPDYILDDMYHELLHCKIGLLSLGYLRVINKQQETIVSLMSDLEETIVDDFMRMARKGMIKDGGGVRSYTYTPVDEVEDYSGNDEGDGGDGVDEG